MAWNYITLTITGCNQCYHSYVDRDKSCVQCGALDDKHLCWLGDDEDKLRSIPDFCPYLEKPPN